MNRVSSLFATACLLAAFPSAAQRPAQPAIPPLDDPANLAGERVSPQALADDLPINHGAAALEQLLLKLRTRASMMLIVAHPDDEDGGLLTYESRGQGVRVAMLTLTRGEGGQNLMSGDFNDALGLIRTQELLAADRYFGVNQMFGTEVDFGFSKTKEEALAKWTHDRVLYDAVRAVRLYRPLVLASVFVGGVTDGHGHHQVAGEITQEVFEAAGDPNLFPEMLKDGLLPWTPLKVYARVPFARITQEGMFDYATGRFSPPRFHNYVYNTDSTTSPVATVTIDEGSPSIASFTGKPTLGMDGLTYVQFARKGLALQKTQIGANVRLAPSGHAEVGYTLMGSRLDCSKTPGCPILAAGMSGTKDSDFVKPVPQSSLPVTEPSLFTGIDTSLPGIADLAPSAPPKLRAVLTLIDGKLAEAQKLFNPSHVEIIVPQLHDALETLDTVIAGTLDAKLDPTEKYNLLHELRIKRVQLNDALVLALSIRFTATATPASGTVIVPAPIHPLQRPELKLQLERPEGPALTLAGPMLGISVAPPAGFAPIPFARKFALNLDLNLKSGSAGYTRPYFSRPDLEQPFYDIAIPADRNAAQTMLPFDPAMWMRFDGLALSTRQIAATDHGPLVTVPPVSVSLSLAAGLIPVPARKFSLDVTVSTQSVEAVAGTLKLKLPSGWTAEPADIPFSVDSVRSKRSLRFEIDPAKVETGQHYMLSAVAEVDGKDYAEGYRAVGYPGLTYTNYYTPATYKATAVDVTTAPKLRVAYLPGTGDEVPAFLPNLGVTATILNAADIAALKPGAFDAVILGVRAYAAHPELAGAGSKPLNDFAAAGGVILVQYNSASDAAGTAPFPFVIPGDSAHNVVEEERPVRILAPNAPLLNWPNKITASDFDHWIEERGHGFASTWAPEYRPLLEMHDQGQDPQEGGLLVANVGKGAYIYCALALYRQLPEGVPGAYRLMANLLSYAKNPERSQK